ncbi:hypothetical protein ACFLXD_02755 [Chloroflexota bacterium]
MKFFNWSLKYIKLAMVIMLLAVLLATAAGCEELGLTPPGLPSAQPESAAPSSEGMLTSGGVSLAVQEHLLNQAKSYEAKRYLAEFYAVADNWSIQAAYFKDGSDIWYVLADMTASDSWEGKSYWKQASWYVFPDGKVMPSNLLHANALRIEADLQELSPEPEPEENGGTGG